MSQWLATLLASGGGGGIVLLVAYIAYLISKKNKQSTTNQSATQTTQINNNDNDHIFVELLKIQKSIDKNRSETKQLKTAFLVYVQNNGADPKVKKQIKEILREKYDE